MKTDNQSQTTEVDLFSGLTHQTILFLSVLMRKWCSEKKKKEKNLIEFSKFCQSFKIFVKLKNKQILLSFN